MWVGIVQSSGGLSRTKRRRRGEPTLSAWAETSVSCPSTWALLVLGLSGSDQDLCHQFPDRSHIIVLNQVERTVLDIARQELLQLTDTNDSSYSCNLSSQHLLQNKGSGIREHSKTASRTPHVASLMKWRTALRKKTEVRKAHEWLGKVRWESDSTRCTVKNIIRSSSINLVCITRWIYS